MKLAFAYIMWVGFILLIALIVIWAAKANSKDVKGDRNRNK